MVTMNENAFNFINLEYMDMMSEGDESMKKVMIEMLVEELPQEIEKMQSLQQYAQWEELSSVSHKMKSTLAFVGNPVMTAANRDIEQIAKKQQEVERIPPLLLILSDLCPKALEELQAVCQKL